MLAEWMNAAYFVSTYRPIPIDDYLVYENAIYPAATSRQLFQTISKLKSMSNATLMECMPPDRVIRPSTFRELANPMTNSTVALAIDTADAGHGALVFCGSRHMCQTQAAVISEAMPAPAENTDELSKRLDLLADLRSLPSGLDPVLEKTLVRGVGFHRKYHSHRFHAYAKLSYRCRNDSRGARTDSAGIRPRCLAYTHSDLQSCGWSQSPCTEGYYQWSTHGQGTCRARNAVRCLCSENSVLSANIREGDRCVEELAAKGKMRRVRHT